MQAVFTRQNKGSSRLHAIAKLTVAREHEMVYLGYQRFSRNTLSGKRGVI